MYIVQLMFDQCGENRDFIKKKKKNKRTSPGIQGTGEEQRRREDETFRCTRAHHVPSVIN